MSKGEFKIHYHKDSDTGEDTQDIKGCSHCGSEVETIESVDYTAPPKLRDDPKLLCDYCYNMYLPRSGPDYSMSQIIAQCFNTLEKRLLQRK